MTQGVNYTREFCRSVWLLRKKEALWIWSLAHKGDPDWYITSHIAIFGKHFPDEGRWFCEIGNRMWGRILCPKAECTSASKSFCIGRVLTNIPAWCLTLQCLKHLPSKPWFPETFTNNFSKIDFKHSAHKHTHILTNTKMKNLRQRSRDEKEKHRHLW